MQATGTLEHSVRKKKSTTVRAELTLATLRWVFKCLHRLAPKLAARFAVFLMFRVPVIKRPKWEASLLSKGKRSNLAWRGGRLAYWSWGSGPVVLLVHGWAGRGSQLGMFVDPLVRRGFRVVAFDGPNHGDTTVKRASMADQAAALQEIASRIGDIWGIVAHSMGAGATLYASHRGLTCSRMVFLAAAPDAPDYFDEFADFFALDQRVRLHIADITQKKYDVKIEDFRTTEYAHEIQNPCLVIHDRDDKEVPVGKSQELSKSIPQVHELYTYGLGHRRILKDGDVIHQVAEFLRAKVQTQKKGDKSC